MASQTKSLLDSPTSFIICGSGQLLTMKHSLCSQLAQTKQTLMNRQHL
jgi:hypothetical protein